MRVLEGKIDAQLIQGKQTGDIITEIRDNPPSTSTFADIISQQNNEPQKASHTDIKTQKVNKRGATKSAVVPVQTKWITSSLEAEEPTIQDLEDDKESGWTTVRNKKHNRQNKQVRVGTNAELRAIQATERKKHLHVWRLHPETTIEAINDHVKTICGSEVQIKIEKIKHKIGRDYVYCWSAKKLFR